MAEKKKVNAKSTKPVNNAKPKKVVNENTTKKVVKESTIKKVNKPEEKEVKIIQNSRDYTDLIKRIITCMYVIIGLLIALGVIMVVVPKSSNWSGTSNDEVNNEEELGEYDVSMFDSITSDNFKKSVSGDTTKIVYIGRDTCGYCVQFLPILQKAQDAYGYKTLYLDITTITTEEQQQKIMAFDNEEKFLEENFGSTPMVLAFKDGKMIDTWVGYSEYEDFANWLKELGLKEK